MSNEDVRKTVTVEAASELKTEMVKSIHKAITDFEDKSGVVVDNISVINDYSECPESNQYELSRTIIASLRL